MFVDILAINSLLRREIPVFLAVETGWKRANAYRASSIIKRNLHA
jgi:hypothetical protein